MTIDRNRLEQEAVKLLQKGKTDQAIERYQALVRDDPRDRRIRQKLSELYLQVGRVSEAEQHLRALAKSLVKSGQERQAVPLFKQLVKIKPDDAELREELGDCFIATGFPDDARKTYDAVLEMLERVYPSKAVPVLQKIIKLAPTEMPLQIKLAELYEASNWSEKAALEWQRLAGEARRLGRPDDRARFLTLALRLRPDMLVLLQEAAEARLATDEPQLALTHLQEAYQASPRNVRSLELLARTFQALQQPESARPVWLAAAQAHADAGAAIARADALRAALACGADDPKIKAEFGEADREAARYRLRLHTQPWAAPRALEAEVLRAEVQARYGFPTAPARPSKPRRLRCGLPPPCWSRWPSCSPPRATPRRRRACWGGCRGGGRGPRPAGPAGGGADRRWLRCARSCPRRYARRYPRRHPRRLRR